MTFTPLPVASAEDNRAALAKAIYSKLFDRLVEQINIKLRSKEPPALHIGVLDIFGFEIFEVNSFEQLCINFANEKLQQFFLTCVFKEEEALHIKEGVPWKDIEFQDNQGCINMLEKPPNGVLRLLDSQCKAPNPTEQNFCKELNKTHAKADFIVPTRKQKMTDDEGFIVRHYAGDVVYAVDGFLEKAVENVSADLVNALRRSTVPLVALLFHQTSSRMEKAAETSSCRGTSSPVPLMFTPR